MSDTDSKPIVVRENVIIGISATLLIAIVVGVFRFGMAFSGFISEQKNTTAEVVRLNAELKEFRVEMVNYVDAQVNLASARRYTSAHDELRTAIFKQRLTGTSFQPVADAYPSFDELQKQVDRYSDNQRPRGKAE